MSKKSPAIHRTPLYRVKAAYANMLRRCENKCGTEPYYAAVKLKMSFEQFSDWALPLYEKFITEFPDESPSVSRFNDTGDYEIGNIEIISQTENRKRQKSKLLLREDGTKTCCQCRKSDLRKEDFGANKRRPDVLHHICKSCIKERNKAYNSKKGA